MTSFNFAEHIYRIRFDENMKKYNEDDVNYCVMCRLIVKFGSYAMRLTSVVLRETIRSVQMQYYLLS